VQLSRMKGHLVHLLLIRHALPSRSEQGHGSDPPLSELGAVMAGRLPSGLRRHRITRVVSSPQLRARQTAQPIADEFGVPLEVFEGLAEYDYGLSEYVPVEQMRAENPEGLARLLDGELPDGVDVGEFTGRVKAAARQLTDSARSRDVVAVITHGGVINVLMQKALETPKLFPFRLDYASISDLSISAQGREAIVMVNNIEHVWDLLPRLQGR